MTDAPAIFLTYFVLAGFLAYIIAGLHAARRGGIKP